MSQNRGRLCYRGTGRVFCDNDTNDGCSRCGLRHGASCPALQAFCHNCGRRGHFRVRCRSARGRGRVMKR